MTYLRVLCQLMAALVVTWTVGFTFAYILQCIPFSINWSKYGNETGQCIDVNRMMIAHAWSDVATDIVILLLPLRCVNSTLLPAKHVYS